MNHESLGRKLVDQLLAEDLGPEPEEEFLPPEQVEEIIADLVAKKLLDLTHTDPNGTRTYMAPPDTFEQVSVIVHPRDKPETWHYGEMPYYVEEESFHDRNHYSPAGSEVLDLSLEDLEAYLTE